MKTQFRVVQGVVSVGNDQEVPVKITFVDDRLPASLIEVGDEPLIKISIPHVTVRDNGQEYPFFDLGTKSVTKELSKATAVVFLVTVEDEKIVWVCWTKKTPYDDTKKAIAARKSGGKKTTSVTLEDNGTYRLTDVAKFVGTPRKILDELTRDHDHTEEVWPASGTWEKHNGKRFVLCPPPECPILNGMLANHYRSQLKKAGQATAA